MHRLRYKWLMIGAIALLLSGAMLGCTRKRPTPTPFPTEPATQVAPTATPEAEQPTPKTTVAAVEEEPAQPEQTPTAAPTPTPAPPPSEQGAPEVPTPTAAPGQPVEHIVQPGEYLNLIARRYGVSPEAIMRANNIQDPNLLYPGQKLIIPAPGAVPGSSGSSPSRKIHIVQRGETLQSIALKYGVTVQELAAANGISNPNFIYVGQRLVIP